MYMTLHPVPSVFPYFYNGKNFLNFISAYLLVGRVNIPLLKDRQDKQRQTKYIFINKTYPLKVVGNEKVGRSRRWLMIDIGLGLL
jgi:hypothetical protein